MSYPLNNDNVISIKITCFLLLIFEIIVTCSTSLAQDGTTTFGCELIESELIINQAPFKQCHASSLVELTDGNIMAAWFGGTHERNPDVCIWGAIKHHDGWSQPQLLADGKINDTLRYPCWNPVLFKVRNGDIYLFYKVGPSPTLWRGFRKISQDNGQTWSLSVELPKGIIGPTKNKPIYLSCGRIISPSSEEMENCWKACMELSDNDGKTWSKVCLDTVVGYKLIQPTLLDLHDGTILALMRSDQNKIVKSNSIDNGDTWSKPVLTNILNPNSGIDAITLFSGLHVLVYNPSTIGSEWSDGRDKLFVMVSADGEHWQDVFKLEDKSIGEFSYPAIIQTQDRMVHISYTYDRGNIKHVVLKIQRK